jgi:D-serine deaminase-like pyridoxal phosphate-dependent protein
MSMNQLKELQTPAAIIEVARMKNNISRMQARMDALGVQFRPHVKTSKCIDVARAQLQAGARGITVSTLKEAEQFFAMGVTDIFYAVGMAPTKLKQAVALRQAGCGLRLLTDHPVGAKAIAQAASQSGVDFEVMIEIDTDGHRSGIRPDQEDALLEIAACLTGGAHVAGVMTHAGSSYEYHTPEDLRKIAEMERAGCVQAATFLRGAGYACPVVSVGSTPTALSAAGLEGVTEVRAGVYVFFDLVMANVGVCGAGDIALSVLTTVIGHQADKGWALVDAGWMAMSRDRGTQKQPHDFGYGLVCDADLRPLDGYQLSSANQEHGIISCIEGTNRDIEADFPIGTQLRILPNHACATGAQYTGYCALMPDGHVQRWERFNGW